MLINQIALDKNLPNTVIKNNNNKNNKKIISLFP